MEVVFLTRLAVVAGITGLSLGGILLPGGPAAAATFEITTADGTLFASSTVTIEGTKDADAVVRIPSLSGGDPYCEVPGVGGGPSEDWSCTFTLPDGAWAVGVEETNGTDAPIPHTVNIRVLGAPTINGSDPLLTTGIISGTGFAGAGIRIVGSGPQDPSGDCTTVLSNGSWSCPLPVTVSGDYQVAVQQTWLGVAGGTSSSRAATIDKDPPPLPSFTQPAAGDRITAQSSTFAGHGENGARVDVFLDGNLTCETFVAGGQWSCAASGLPSGQHTVQAIQWDAAGNASGATTGFAVTVATPATGPAEPDDPAAPAQPSAPSQPANPSSPAPSAQPTFPLFPPPVGGASGLPPGETWDTPTGYGAALPSVAQAARDGSWWWGLLMALAFVAGVALPARLLVATLAGRIAWRPRRIAGRNRDDVGPDDDRPILRPWMTVLAAMGAAVVFATLAGGVQGEVRYLRLLLAIAVALAVLGCLGVVLPAKLAGVALGSSAGIRLVPAFLMVGAVAALVSRAGGIQPPIIVGVVIAAAFAPGTPARTEGIASLVQLGALTLLGFGAWLGHSAIGPVDGFAPSLASEILATLCIAALGSVVLLLLPVGRMPGRKVFELSKPAWFAAALAASTLAAVVIVQAPTFPVAWIGGAALLFGAGSLGTWAWVRFVEPALGRETARQ